VTNIEDNIIICYTQCENFISYYNKNLQYLPLDKSALRFVEAKSCTKSHLFKTFYQLHTTGKTLPCLDRNTGFLDNKNPTTDNTGCQAYSNQF